MKRISDFEDCRMDMKKMAALNGGGATSYSVSARTTNGCGDTGIWSWTDETGYGGVVRTISETFKEIPWECPPSASVVSTNPSLITSSNSFAEATSSYAGTANLYASVV